MTEAENRIITRQLAPTSLTRVLRSTFPPNTVVVAHRHPWGQLVHAAEGVLTVVTEAGTWVVPPDRAVWVPPGTLHEVRAPRGASQHSVYVAAAEVARSGLPAVCRVVAMTPLLREVVWELGRRGNDYLPDGPEARLARVAMDLIAALPAQPLHLPEPADRRLRALTRALEADPADNRPLEDWGRAVGASPRTLARLFREETGLTFAGWRARLRLLRALQRLAAGEAVTTVALDLGYESPSAFIAMFRRTLGTTPGAYFAAGGDPRYGSGGGRDTGVEGGYAPAGTEP